MSREEYCRNACATRLLRWLLSATIILALAPSVAATTIIILVTPNFVALGSDSLTGQMAPNDESSVLGCKIKQSNGIFVAAAGAFGEEGNSGFNAYDFADQAAAKGGDVITIANRFERAVRGPFTTFVRGFRQKIPASFNKYCNHRDCLQVAFVGFYNGQGELSVRSFSVVTRGQATIVTPVRHEDCPGNCLAGSMQAMLGDDTEATALVHNTPHFWDIKGLDAGMDELVALESQTYPKEVSFPVSILVVDRSGARWRTGHQGVCPDIVH